MHQLKKIAVLSHFRNLKDFILLLIIMSFISSIYFLNDKNIAVFLFFGIPMFISVVPVVLIHVNYFKNDKGKSLQINGNKSMIINSYRLRVEIATSNIHRIVKTTGFKGYSAMVWSRYFYYQIELKTGDVIYLTSLLLNKNDFPFNINEVRNIVFPVVKYYKVGSDKLKNDELRQKEIDYHINGYYKIYFNYPLDELQRIIDNKDDFQKEAVEAAKKLIEEKITVANKPS